MAGTDPFATSKANLRDTVKWLATVIATLATLVIAGTPFSNFGTLEPFTVRFWVAAIVLLIAALCLMAVWLRLLQMLRPDAVFKVQMRSQYALPSDPTERQELDELRKHLDAHRTDLLPTGANTFDDLERVVDKEWNTANSAPGNAAALEKYKGYAANVEMYLNYATFARLHQRISRGIPFVLTLAAVAALALFAFAYAANPPKTAPGDRIVVVQTAPPTPPAAGPAPPTLTPVRFEPGSARLDGSAIEAIATARTFLRQNDTAGLVIFAHTDTTGGEARNRSLAAERGAAVRRVLLQEGGIAGSRVFVAELPKADLPALTLPQIRNAENRAVEFLVVTMPARK